MRAAAAAMSMRLSGSGISRLTVGSRKLSTSSTSTPRPARMRASSSGVPCRWTITSARAEARSSRRSRQARPHTERSTPRKCRRPGAIALARAVVTGAFLNPLRHQDVVPAEPIDVRKHAHHGIAESPVERVRVADRQRRPAHRREAPEMLEHVGIEIDIEQVRAAEIVVGAEPDRADPDAPGLILQERDQTRPEAASLMRRMDRKRMQLPGRTGMADAS